MSLPTRDEIEKEHEDQARIELCIVNVESLPSFVANTRIKMTNGNNQYREIIATVYEQTNLKYSQYLPHKIVYGKTPHMLYYHNSAKPKFQMGTVCYIIVIDQEYDQTFVYDGRCDVFIDQNIRKEFVVSDRSDTGITLNHVERLTHVFLIGEQSARQLIDLTTAVANKGELSEQTKFYINDTQWDNQL